MAPPIQLTEDGHARHEGHEVSPVAHPDAVVYERACAARLGSAPAALPRRRFATRKAGAQWWSYPSTQ
jgi:hypothetical protein